MRERKNDQIEWASEAGRFIELDIDPVPMIKGIRDYERALEWHREAHKHNASKRVKKCIAQKLEQLDE